MGRDQTLVIPSTRDKDQKENNLPAAPDLDTFTKKFYKKIERTQKSMTW